MLNIAASQSSFSVARQALAQPVEQKAICDGLINLSAPAGSERVRGFQPPWRTVWLYKCPKCGGQKRGGAGRFSGRRPVPSVGAIICGRVV